MISFLAFLAESGYGIPHLEDLQVDEMLRLLKNLSTLRIVQKLDGANLHVGVDLEGKLYTSREQKGGDRFYDAADFPKRSAYDGFKSASLALFTVGDTIQRVLSKGQEASVEVLFGPQPNTVLYGKDGYSYIAFLEPMDGDDPTKALTQEDLDGLVDLLRNKVVNITAIKHDTTDGKSMIKGPAVTPWKFTSSDKVPNEMLVSKHLDGLIKDVDKFLSKRSSAAQGQGEHLSNYEVLSSKEKALAPDRERLKVSLSKLLAPIKAELLKASKKIKPSLRDTKLTSQVDAYTGIEGLIFTDEKTKEHFKVVDQDEFSAVNTFNYSVRNRLLGRILTGDLDAPLESRGGLLGTAKIRCVNLFGIHGAEAPSQARKVLEQFAKKGEKLGMQDLEAAFSALSLGSIRRKCGAVFTHALSEVDDELDAFKSKPPEQKIGGKKMTFTPEVRRRTLLTFAEAAAEGERMLKKIRNAETLADLFVVLVGKGVFGWA